MSTLDNENLTLPPGIASGPGAHEHRVKYLWPQHGEASQHHGYYLAGFGAEFKT